MMDVEALDASPILVAGPMNPRTPGTQAEIISTEVTADALDPPKDSASTSRKTKKKTAKPKKRTER
jgi:hypothetical protein